MHPLQGSMEGFLDSVMPELTREAVKKAVAELVDDYLVQRNFRSE